MTKKKRIMIWVLCLSVALAALIAWIAWGNTALELTKYTVPGESLPAPFEGYRIAQVSDLHNAEMGEGNHRLLTMLKDTEPDIIVITGDFVDSEHTDVAIALDFAKEAVAIAPCYYVTGNHEAMTEAYATLKEGLIALGVTVLENARVELEREGETITLMGVLDPSFSSDGMLATDDAVMKHTLDALTSETDGYTVLLSHRPELFDTYVDSGVELVFCGHAHGGQFRLPFVGGVVAPGQGLFPAYDAGVYTQADTHMVVSRGIGNSIIPLRINNRPEVVLVELAKD